MTNRRPTEPLHPTYWRVIGSVETHTTEDNRFLLQDHFLSHSESVIVVMVYLRYRIISFSWASPLVIVDEVRQGMSLSFVPEYSKK